MIQSTLEICRCHVPRAPVNSEKLNFGCGHKMHKGSKKTAMTRECWRCNKQRYRTLSDWLLTNLRPQHRGISPSQATNSSQKIAEDICGFCG